MKRSRLRGRPHPNPLPEGEGMSADLPAGGGKAVDWRVVSLIPSFSRRPRGDSRIPSPCGRGASLRGQGPGTSRFPLPVGEGLATVVKAPGTSRFPLPVGEGLATMVKALAHRDSLSRWERVRVRAAPR